MIATPKAAPCCRCGTTGGYTPKSYAAPKRRSLASLGIVGHACESCYSHLRRLQRKRNVLRAATQDGTANPRFLAYQAEVDRRLKIVRAEKRRRLMCGMSAIIPLDELDALLARGGAA